MTKEELLKAEADLKAWYNEQTRVYTEKMQVIRDEKEKVVEDRVELTDLKTTFETIDNTVNLEVIAAEK